VYNRSLRLHLVHVCVILLNRTRKKSKKGDSLWPTPSRTRGGATGCRDLMLNGLWHIRKAISGNTGSEFNCDRKQEVEHLVFLWWRFSKYCASPKKSAVFDAAKNCVALINAIIFTTIYNCHYLICIYVMFMQIAFAKYSRN
jgi:hypothetical protein